MFKQILSHPIIKDSKCPMTSLLIIINIFVFVLQIVIPQFTEIFVMRSDVWYSYLSGCFLHGDIGHISGNMLFMSFICLPLEERYGGRLILWTYVLTGIMGSMLFAFFMPESTALGASGSICGLMMVWILHNIMERRYLLLIPALFYFMMQGVMSGLSLIMGSGVGYLAHFGSAIGGLFMLPLMLKKRS